MSAEAMAMKVLGALEKARKTKDLTQQQVADKLKMDRGNFARMEGGASLPNSGRLFQWAHAVGVEIGVINDAKAAAE